MTGWLEQEVLLRFISFVGIFALMAVWEVMDKIVFLGNGADRHGESSVSDEKM